MCTALSLVGKNKDIYFGRTMDFSHELDPEIYIVPREYEWNNELNNYTIRNKYKFMGIGQNIGHVVFTDGINEKGLAVAVLYFSGYAEFKSIDESNKSLQLASIDMVNFLLGNCSSVFDVKNIIDDVDIIGVEDALTNTIAPLHWFLTDTSGNCIAIEQTKDGLKVFNNMIGVLANSPDFRWHLTNLRNYINLTSKQYAGAKWGAVTLTPFGQGGGTSGLPGDYTPPGRFVRLAFLKSWAFIPDDDNDTINLGFNLLKNVTIPKGIVITASNNPDYTQYTTFINVSQGAYYFNTYNNNQIFVAKIQDYNYFNLTSLGKIKKPITFINI